MLLTATGSSNAMAQPSLSAHGVTQKEYVSVPDELLERTQELAPYFAASADYAQTLKPKATKRPGTASPQG